MIARLEDRYRGFVVDGTPVATGVVAVADSWACSNPANGRGASIGMLHALTLRHQLRAVGLGDPAAFARVFHAATAETVEPWYRTTLATDRHRLAEIEAAIHGDTYDSQDSHFQLEKALGAALPQDPDCLRAFWTSGSYCGRLSRPSPGRGCATRPSSSDPAGANSRPWARTASNCSHWYLPDEQDLEQVLEQGLMSGPGQRRG